MNAPTPLKNLLPSSGVQQGTDVVHESAHLHVTGSATYTLQFTADDPFASNFVPASDNWKSHPSMTSATISDIVEFTAPVRAVRINQTAGAGSVSATVIQMDV